MHDRRQIKNFVIVPQAQIRLLWPFLGLLCVSTVIVVLMVYSSVRIHGEIRETLVPDNLFVAMKLDQLENRLMWLSVLGIITLGLMTFFSWLAYTHRIFGPMVPIRRRLIELEKGEWQGELKLRKRDEFQDVAGLINDLSATLKSEKGLSLIELMVTVAISSVVLMALTSLGAIMHKQQGQSNLAFQADTTRRMIKSLLNNPTAWLETTKNTSDNPSLACLSASPHTACTTDGTDTVARAFQNAPINVIYDSTGAKVFNFTDPKAGFDMAGNPCSAFVTPAGGGDYNGNDQCPLRYEVKWTAECTGTSCINPMIHISVDAKFNPAANGTVRSLPFNTKQYSDKFYQGSGGESCWQMQAGGLIDTCQEKVGIGTTTPGEKIELAGNLTVSGQIFTKPFSTSASGIDWDKGNTVLTTFDCPSGSNITFANLRDGGTYSLVVNPGSATACGFSPTTSGKDTATLTYRFRPANDVRIAGAYTVYTLQRIGTTVLVSWASGF